MSPNAEMVKLASNSSQACLNVPQTFPMRQLRKRHTEPLIPARESAQLPIGIVTRDARLKSGMRKELHQLGENCATLIHSSLFDEIAEIVFARNAIQTIRSEQFASGFPFLNRTGVQTNPFVRVLFAARGYCRASGDWRLLKGIRLF